MAPKTGPLAGLTVIEMAGLGPVPLAGLMLAEMGARVIRIERPSSGQSVLDVAPRYDLDRHGREILKLDLKMQAGVDLLLRLIDKSDVVMEGFRPGVMERIGAGPEVAMARNPALVYGRMTGFGQDGPLSARAGHDLTYLAYSGVLHAIGQREGKPVPPLNLVADYGGGTMFLVTGILAALVARSVSGKGQVVDAAMIDGASMLAAPYFGFMATGFWTEERGSNLLDSGAPFYDTYEASDRRHVAVACLEPQFFAEFARLLPLDERFRTRQYDKAGWEDMRVAIAARLATKTRDEWSEVFEASDACVAPVLTFSEARSHPHNKARRTHVSVGDMARPAPAPRFSRSPSQVSAPATLAADLTAFGIDEQERRRLAADGVIGQDRDAK